MDTIDTPIAYHSVEHGMNHYYLQRHDSTIHVNHTNPLINCLRANYASDLERPFKQVPIEEFYQAADDVLTALGYPFTRTVTPRRPLASLTAEECQTLFALAFGHAPPLERLKIFSLVGPITIRSPAAALILYPDGQILATVNPGNDAVAFNARKLIAQLDAYNVAFGDDPGSVAQG